MATRGSFGGLPRCTDKVVKLLDAFGKDLVIVETVGVGQTDWAVMEVADIVCLLLSPESGDNIQFMKAGIMEIADVIVMNKADRGKVEAMVSELKALLSLSPNCSRPDTAILITEAINNIGINELFEELQRRGLTVKEAKKPSKV
jgi:LAO/AO transport system kinase